MFPWLDTFDGIKSVLIAGAGGGFDIYGGLPLQFELEARGHEVHLANLTFSSTRHLGGDARLAKTLVRIDPDTEGKPEYFPERALSRWFRSQGRDKPVYCFEKAGVVPTIDAYKTLIEHTGAQAVVLVDGGADALLKGDETSLGSPEEDAISLVALGEQDVELKQIICVGLGTDARHGVAHVQVLRVISELSQTGDYLGAVAMLKEMPSVASYMDAVGFAFEDMGRESSYVHSTVLHSLEGYFGEREGHTGWCNPLASMCWAFNAEPIIERLIFRDLLLRTTEMHEVTLIIRGVRKGLDIMPRETIPI